MGHGVEGLRNLVLLGHGGAGKTALVDALAFKTKIAARHGNTSDGSSISDTEPEEKERHQTLTSHVFHMPWKNRMLHVIDTPGHADFLADAISSMSAVETAVFVVDASSGVTFHTRRLWQEAGRRGIGRMVVLTKIDTENVAFDTCLQSIVDSLGDRVVPLTVPDGNGSAFTCCHSVIAGEGEGAAGFRGTLEERIAEADDALMEKYFEQGELSADEIAANLPSAICKGTIAPLLTVSPPSEKGVEQLLDFVADSLPNPVQAGPRMAAAAADSEEFGIEVGPDPSGPFAGYVFKVVSDPFVGKMSYIRGVRGRAVPDEGFTIARTGHNEKVGGYLWPQGKETENLESISVGEIVAVAKIESLQLGDTVTKAGESVFLEQPKFPTPMVAVAVRPESRGDEQKLGPALEKLAAEDPTFLFYRDADTSELVCEGMSSLHLDVTFHKLAKRYKVGVERHVPKIPYRETVQGSSEGHYRHKKQSGGRGQFGEVYLRLRALERGAGFKFVDRIVGGAIPRQFIPEVEKGIQNSMTKGPLAGYTVVDCEVEVYDGKFHDVDSDQISFQIAGARAFADAFQKAKPILLEPVMNLVIHVPSRFVGDITSNLSSLRARMTGMDSEGDDQIIRAVMPLKEAREYQTQLRSITAGEGTFTMAYSHYDPLPGNLQADIIAASKAADKD